MSQQKENIVPVGVSFSYWGLENVVSNNFNRLKGKIFNLIEATIPDKTQAEAMKGLIKGFANDEFRSTVTDMRFHAEMAGLIKKDEGRPCDFAEPLEVNFGDR
jgi:hypothetical protein